MENFVTKQTQEKALHMFQDMAQIIMREGYFSEKEDKCKTEDYRLDYKVYELQSVCEKLDINYSSRTNNPFGVAYYQFNSTECTTILTFLDLDMNKLARVESIPEEARFSHRYPDYVDEYEKQKIIKKF